MNVIVINCGSSSIKYQAFDMRTREVLATGLLEKIGENDSVLTHKTRIRSDDFVEHVIEERVGDHRAGFDLIDRVYWETGRVDERGELVGIGHRVVHGGDLFSGPTVVDDQVIEEIRDLIPLAPLHNPANLLGIEIPYHQDPSIPNVAVFDTAFHQTIPAHAYTYAIPATMAKEYRIRRYGFHGTSHKYVSERVAEHLGKPAEEVNTIVCHLGNGASICAVEGGRSVDTSMGLTPLEGLVMGTRCGDLDPAVVFYLAEQAGLSTSAIDKVFNKESGLKGICGVNDMREVHSRREAGDEEAQLAFEVFCYRVRKYVGGYAAALGRVDAVAFTAGIGENDAKVRAGSLEGLAGFGISLDAEKNNTRKPAEPLEVQSDDSASKVMIVPTDEELEIALQTLQAVQG